MSIQQGSIWIAVKCYIILILYIRNLTFKIYELSTLIKIYNLVHLFVSFFCIISIVVFLFCLIIRPQGLCSLHKEYHNIMKVMFIFILVKWNVLINKIFIFRHNLLGSLQRDSTAIHLHDLQQSMDDAEPSILERSVQVGSSSHLTSFSWHPTHENRLLTIAFSGKV